MSLFVKYCIDNVFFPFMIQLHAKFPRLLSYFKFSKIDKTKKCFDKIVKNNYCEIPIIEIIVRFDKGIVINL